MDKLYVYNAVKLPVALPKPAEMKQLPKDKKILVISPHSDDVSVALGGTITTLSGTNKIVPVLFFSGSRGVAGKTKEEGTAVREEEMQEESKILGIEEPIFLRLNSYYKEGLAIEDEEILKVEKVLEEQKPDLIFLPKKDDSQPRHRMATQIVLKALKQPRLRQPGKFTSPILFFYESPWSLFSEFEFNVVFILPKKAILNKMEAIKQHHSQLARTPFDKAALSVAAFRGAVVLEQRVFGYGKAIEPDFDIFIEAFRYEPF